MGRSSRALWSSRSWAGMVGRGSSCGCWLGSPAALTASRCAQWTTQVSRVQRSTSRFVTACLVRPTRTSTGCTQCPVNQYSFQASASCTLCDPNALCDGGPVLVPKKGFWHSTFNSSDVQPCPNRKACQADRAPLQACQADRVPLQACQAAANCSANTASYHNLQCSVGYAGNLCGSCRKDQGFGLGLYLRCAKCMRRHLAVVVVVVMTVVACSMVVYVAVRSLLEASAQPQGSSTALQQYLQGSPAGASTRLPAARRSNTTTTTSSSSSSSSRVDLSDVFKVLVLHLQYLGIIGNLLVDWPRALRVMIDVTRLLFAASSSDIVSWDCLGDLSNATMFALSMGVPLVVVLLACGAVAALMRSPWRRLLLPPMLDGRDTPRRNRGIHRDPYIVTGVVGLFLFYSLLVSTSLSAFSCISVDGTSYWIKDMAVQCCTRRHLQSALPLGLLGTLVFCCCLPAATMWWLAANHTSMGTPSFRRRYGFLYRLYRPQYYFWEGVVCLQTMALVAVDLFGRRFGTDYQLLMLLAVLVANYTLVSVLQPFRCRHLQRLYAAGTVTLQLTCLGVQALLRGYSLEGGSAPEAAKNVVVVAIMAANVAFVGVCIHLMGTAAAGVAKQSLQSASVLLRRGATTMSFLSPSMRSQLGSLRLRPFGSTRSGRSVAWLPPAGSSSVGEGKRGEGDAGSADGPATGTVPHASDKGAMLAAPQRPTSVSQSANEG